MRRLFLALVFGLALTQTTTSELSAQGPNSHAVTRVPATIALADRLPGDSRFVVKRFPGRARHDVIVLATDASEVELGLAIRTLLTVRQTDGDVPTIARTQRMRPAASPQAQRAPFPWIGRVLGDVKRADRMEIEGIGAVRAVQIWLPRQNRARSPRPEPRV